MGYFTAQTVCWGLFGIKLPHWLEFQWIFCHIAETKSCESLRCALNVAVYIIFMYIFNSLIDFDTTVGYHSYDACIHTDYSSCKSWLSVNNFI